MGKLRCAIYTRKSSQEGLEQDFNSLHAQREACEAYIKSQAGEGWSAIRTAYDDGGFSGGSMERPALKALLADIDRGLIDVVVVYKVDRLTRSLSDFAKIVEAFDRKGVSFVSVTQAFNTTSSMGRLTLNVLLSFAQFEREVTGERIRDKLAASKAKGMWMGGNLPLGYDVKDRQLIVNEQEAELVRRIFDRYLALKSVEDLRAELDANGRRSKAWVTRAGHATGGRPFSRGALLHVLKNPLYTGRIPHKDKSYPGLHQPIVTVEQFEAVQSLLAANAANRRARPAKVASGLLKGRLFDADGQPMSPSFSYGKGGRTFSYYVSAPGRQGRASRSRETIRRVSAPPLEALVLDRLGRIGAAEERLDQLRKVQLAADAVHLELAKPFSTHVSDVAVRARLEPTDAVIIEGDSIWISVAVRPVFRGGRTWLVAPDGQAAIKERRPDPALRKALRNAHALQATHSISPLGDPEGHQEASSPEHSYQRKLVGLGYLAPDIQQAIVEGRQPPGLTLQRLIELDLPLAWEDQRRLLGF